ncbi:heat shock 70 kDa protein 16-like [Cucurbita pepo subsp. pepo]|uniref:heat shock 70 kDa protein 16-like n=1 Tax=Cucurbita pepo subsp. pepo TaxID=3664 RepID=UPI000C9D380A|nr:heat shock 70 kDa protein 16-like [Cucurbita pepo subsp. pepo]XP_023535707.1 heat shock 70 kDa protein 16-like [Cucurbita pepo subsp. pepo]XP_023535708.1 heat shock 70 kDa protein 16-like [Cucurbita pepo subsp. pepo]XP_023535709.1 heat shock 70 kDa protein 16-like [Cucurbita pepo subsp. pepo]
MSVVGFDIGNENCVIAVSRQRGIDVLLNEESQRETPAVICFGEKQRFLGSAGAASATMNPRSTISQVKRLIGRNYGDPDVQKDLETLPFETSPALDGSILVHVKYLGETHTFTPVQIMAMLFAHLRDVAEKNLGAPFSDCVIGIPSYFTDLQRRLYSNAAAIAGLKPLRLMHDCTATALSYGIYKADVSNKGPIYVAFVDIGHCDTQVSIVSFQPGHMSIMSHTFDSDLGGRDFDELLFSHFVAEFKKNYDIDVNSNVKASIRLRAACEKLKNVLSANLEAPLNIECLMDEKDVKGFIKREEFEKLAAGLLERISVPCTRALADAGLTVGRIHSVELVGSGSRIPAITRLLASVFKKEPSRKLNASECVARGCALQCAMLSPDFRVREYEVQDSSPFSIGFSSDAGPISLGSNNVLFPKGQHIPSTKVLSFHRNSLFHLEAFYTNLDDLPPGMSSKIGCFTIGPVQGSNNSNSNARIKVRVQLNLNGIVTVESATLVEDNVDEQIPTRDATHSNTENMETEFVDSSHSKCDVSRKVRSTRRIDIPVSEHIYGGMTKAELSEAQQRELQLAQMDKNMEQAKNEKNALESYVYEMRNKLFNTYRSFASDQEREGIFSSLQQTEEWLYEDGDDETESAYASKLDDLKKLVDPVINRYEDEEARAQAKKHLLKRISDYRNSGDSISPHVRASILEECDRAEQWLTETSQQQELLPKNTDPLLWSSEIRTREDDFDKTCQRILGQPVSSHTHSGDSEEPNHHNSSDNHS